MGDLLIVGGRIEVGCPGFDWDFLEKLLSIDFVELVGAPAILACESLDPIGIDDAEVDGRDVFVSDTDVWGRSIPDPFGRNVDSFCGDRFDQVVAQFASDAIGESVLSLQGRFVGCL